MRVDLRSSGCTKLKYVGFLLNGLRKIDVVWVVGASFILSQDGEYGT